MYILFPAIHQCPHGGASKCDHIKLGRQKTEGWGGGGYNKSTYLSLDTEYVHSVPCSSSGPSWRGISVCSLQTWPAENT